MGKALAGALVLALALVDGGCGAGASGGSTGKRVVVVRPRSGGPVDAGALALRIASRTGAQVTLREVDVLSEEAVRTAAREIVAERPSLIVAPSSEMVFGLRNETQAIPVLFVTMADPVQTSLVADERRPRGNVSGFSFDVPIGAKQLEVLERAFPTARRVGVVGDRAVFGSLSFRMLSDAARGPLGVQIERVHFETPADLAPALASGERAGVDAWLVPAGGAAYRFASELVAAIAATGKPALYGSERFVRLGGLMSYSPSFEDPSERVASMALTVLQGYPVGDLPVERPQLFRFAVNTLAWSKLEPRPSKKVLLLASDFYPSDASR
jgi:putative ABC transport system substrate-binding protein